MRAHLRTIVVIALAVALLALFFRNVDLGGVAREIVHARPDFLALALTTVVANLMIRAWRWRYLLAPIGTPSFNEAFRATAVGFAANSLLPARAGEVIRPYFLARRTRTSATGAFATIILERVLDLLTVVGLLAIDVFLAAPPATASKVAFEAVKWAGATAAAGSLVALVLMFLLAKDPARLAAAFGRLERVLPSKLAGLLASVAEKFAVGLGAVRNPERLAVSLGLSLPLWLSIAVGVWATARAFHLAIPFAGSFLVLALLTVGVAFPTPGAVGGFHAAFRYAATTFFGAADAPAVGAAIVLHALSIIPALLLGLFFAAQEGLNLSGMRHLAEQAEPRQPA